MRSCVIVYQGLSVSRGLCGVACMGMAAVQPAEQDRSQAQHAVHGTHAQATHLPHLGTRQQQERDGQLDGVVYKPHQPVQDKGVDKEVWSVPERCQEACTHAP